MDYVRVGLPLIVISVIVSFILLPIFFLSFLFVESRIKEHRYCLIYLKGC